MHQAFHLGRGHLHKEAVALDAADATRQGLTHQWFGGAGLGHRHHVVLKLLNEATTAVETVGQPMAEAVLERGQLGRRQQGPIDGAMARIRRHFDSNFMAHGGTVLAVHQQAHQQVLVEDISVMQAGAAPGGEGQGLSRQGIFSGLRPVTERLQGLTQLLLQGSATITGQDQRQ